MFPARSESKRQFSIFSALATLIASTIVIFPVSSEPASASFDGNNETCNLTNGTGSQGDPYLISTVAELWELVDCGGLPNAGKHFILLNDISVHGDLSAPTSSPIGRNDQNCDSGAQGNPFSGIFNGNNKTISGLEVVDGCFVGLFSKLSNSTIFDLSLQGSVTNDEAGLTTDTDRKSVV
jgi:hypothetical protein